MQDLIERLAKLNWTQPEWRSEAAWLLSDHGHMFRSILSHWTGRDAGSRSDLLFKSHETSTHYKWLLYRDPGQRFVLWLHEYKTAALRGAGYAQIPHNHRYSLCSRILSGGYRSHLYMFDGVLTEVGTKTYRERDILSLDHREIHALSAIQDQTVTILVEGPRQKEYSLAFRDNAAPHKHFEFEVLFNRLVQALSAAEEHRSEASAGNDR